MEAGLKPLSYKVCGKEISPGGVFYIGRTEIISGSDGILPKTEESSDRIIEKALNEISRVKTSRNSWRRCVRK